MKKFFVLVALLGVSAASIGCGGDTAKKADPAPAPSAPSGDAPADPKTP